MEAAGRGRGSKGREACSMDCMSLSKRKDGGRGNEADMNWPQDREKKEIWEVVLYWEEKDEEGVILWFGDDWTNLFLGKGDSSTQKLYYINKNHILISL